jgi:hypothetical protein
VPARRGERERAFRSFLTADFRKVSGRAKRRRTLGGRWFATEFKETVEESNSFFEPCHAVDFKPFDDGRFGRVLDWNDDSAEFVIACERCEAGCAADRSHHSVEGKLASKGELREAIIGTLADDSLHPKHRDRDG